MKLKDAAQIIKPRYDAATDIMDEIVREEIFGEARKQAFATFDAIKAIYAYAKPGNPAVAATRTFEDVIDFAKGFIAECEEYEDDDYSTIERNAMQGILDLLMDA